MLFGAVRRYIRIKMEKSCLLRFVSNQSVSECVLINVTFWQLLLSFWNNVFLCLLVCLTPFGDTHTPRSSEIIMWSTDLDDCSTCVLLLRNALGQSLTLFVIHQDLERKTDGYNSPCLPLLHRSTCQPKYIVIESLECCVSAAIIVASSPVVQW